jgi:hypothetical protein
MSKEFRRCDLKQSLLLPPLLQDWLPEGHLGRFAADVVEAQDLAAIDGKYEENDGRVSCFSRKWRVLPLR